MENIEARIDEGLAFHRAGQLAQAERCYREVLAVRPAHADALHLLGLLAHQTGHQQAAVDLIGRAIVVRPQAASFHNSLGEALRCLTRDDEAIAAYQRALQLDPDFAEAVNNLGTVYQNQGWLDLALQCYERALTIKPDYASAHYNRARVWLSQGDLRRGWAEYEWRWLRGDLQRPARAISDWDGTPLAGRTLLVEAEQGLGDTLQFIRYAPLLAAQADRVVVEVQPPLLPLLATSGFTNVVGQGSSAPPCDVRISLLSVPRVLQTTIETIPRTVPYLRARADLVEHWRCVVHRIEGFRIGIHWQGNPRSPLEPWRSMPLACFEPVARVPGVRLLSLQQGFGSEQLEQLAGRFDVLWFDAQFDAAHGPFMDTAAVLVSLDLVITSDSAVAHLAGALGVPVWLLLPRSADWRWLHAGETSPWYPTLRLYRQQQLGQWADVFAQVANDLQILTRQSRRQA